MEFAEKGTAVSLAWVRPRVSQLDMLPSCRMHLKAVDDFVRSDSLRLFVRGAERVRSASTIYSLVSSIMLCTSLVP